MPSGFFVLMRFYLRVDDTLARVVDARLYHAAGSDYVLREYTERESSWEELKANAVRKMRGKWHSRLMMLDGVLKGENVSVVFRFPCPC